MVTKENNLDLQRESVEREYEHKASSRNPGLSEGDLGSANYSAEELATADEVYSFGCGNPLAFSQVKEGDRVLDLGCGAGLDLILAAARVGASGEVIGIDMTSAMLERARKNIARSGHQNIKLHQGVIEDLPVETGSVDWVISNCVVNLSPDKAKVFAEISRVLKPGGQMLISDIVIDGVPKWVRSVAKRFNPAIAATLGEADYVAGLQRAGLQSIEIKARQAYDRATLYSMISSDLAESHSPWLVRKAGTALAGPVANAAEGKVVSIKVFAQRMGA